MNSSVEIFYLVTWAIEIIAGWMIFQKAGEAGWKVLIPFYNAIVMLRFVGRPGWWLILLLIPIVNLVFVIIVLNDLSKSFGHGGGFTAGLFFLPFIFAAILAFGSSKYLGPRGETPPTPGEEVAAW